MRFGFGFWAGAGVAVSSLIIGCDTVENRAKPDEKAWLYAPTASRVAGLRAATERGLTLTDWHIHIRGGMTAQKALEREQASGIESCVLENYGREWPLSNTVALAQFIRDCQQVKRPDGRTLRVGIQVNDRDWYQQIDPALFQKLDYVLADTMIMGITTTGTPQRLWFPDVKIADPEAWMRDYLAHNLRILNEPITILANPTYLPPCISNRYEQLWTEERMKLVIAKAVERNVALEIQAESPYPKPAFIRLAKKMGAKFSFGSNNFADKTKDVSVWFDAIEAYDLKTENMIAVPTKK